MKPNVSSAALRRVMAALCLACAASSAPLQARPLAAEAETLTAPARSAAAIVDPLITRHRTLRVDDVDIFYREAGRADAPVVVLLHGFPTSSHMFRKLIPALADRYRVIAPDYPGFGQSGMPARKDFAYGFGTFTERVDGLLTRLGVQRYALYLMDYGAPVGLRLALRHPERVTALVVQNGNAYEEGLREFWDPIKAYWREDTAERRDALRTVTTLEATRFQYLDGVRDPSRVHPANWVHDQALLDRPGNVEIQLDLFQDYRSNIALYPRFQAYFREYQPPTLIVWGSNDKIFPPEGAHPYLRDLPKAELHLLDTGHFALEDKGAEITALMRDFLARSLPRQ